MQRRRLSVVVVARNLGVNLPDVLARVRAQQVPAEVEVVLVSTRAVAATVRTEAVIEMAADAGDAECWNAGLEHARGDVAVLLSPRALPADPLWLAQLVRPFSDPRVAAVFAQRLPHPDALSGFVPSLSRRVQFDTQEAFDALPPDARRLACAFDPACVAVRRQVWSTHRFVSRDGADGAGWAREVLRAGHALVHARAPAVYFSQPPAPLAALAASARVSRQLHRLLGPGPLSVGALRGAFSHRADGSALGRRERLRAAATLAAEPLGALAGDLWARVEARLFRGAGH